MFSKFQGLTVRYANQMIKRSEDGSTGPSEAD